MLFGLILPDVRSPGALAPLNPCGTRSVFNGASSLPLLTTYFGWRQKPCPVTSSRPVRIRPESINLLTEGIVPRTGLG